jgi:hypothetical protein
MPNPQQWVAVVAADGTVAPLDSSGLQVQGAVASDAAEAGNPVQIGLSVDEASPTAAAEGDVRRVRGSAEGDMAVQPSFEGANIANANGEFVQGPVASDAAAAGNPIQMGAVVDESTIVDVGEGDIRELRITGDGSLITTPFHKRSNANADGLSHTDIIGVHATATGEDLFSSTRALLMALAPDDAYDRIRSLGNTALLGLGQLAAAPWVPGASTVQTAVVTIPASSRDRATIITPASGKKIRVISYRVVSDGLSTDPDRVSIFFGTGTAYTTTPASAVGEGSPGTTGSFGEIFPDGGGPVGSADEILAWLTETETETAMRITVHYREE